MLMAVKKYFNYLKQSMKCNFLSVIEYKQSFFIQCLFMFINNGFFLIFWNVIFNASEGNINGITMNDILYIWSLPTAAYGIAFFFFGGIKDLGKHILEGGLDTFLVQPKNVLINVMFSRMDFSACGDLLYGLVLGLFATEFNMERYILMILLAIVGAIFYICTEAIIRLLTVFVGDTDNISQVYIVTLLVTFSTYPEAIYGKFVKLLIYTVVPAAYVAFVPIKFVITLDFKFLTLLLGAAAIYIFATAMLSRLALKKYESGNSMALRG